ALTATSFVDITAQVGEHWFYKITAVDFSANESSFSAAADATRTDTTPPAVPGTLTATAQTDGIKLSWGAVGDVDLAGYRIYRSSSDTGTFDALNGGQLVTGGATMLTDTNVAPGERWYYRVTAVDAAGNESAPTN